jgi:molecular chaperone GrpE
MDKKDNKEKILKDEQPIEDAEAVLDNEEKTADEPLVTITQQEYEQLKNSAAQAQDTMLRIQADFENSRRRLDRDKHEFVKYANDQIITQLIPFVDDFKRALEAADKTNDFNVLHKGVEMILKHMLELLKQKGVTEIEALGKPFDPAVHEAMLQVETDEYPENTVVEELEKGYLLNDRVLRTAKVKVAKAIESE